MTKHIEPLHEVTPPPDPVPARHELSEVYTRTDMSISADRPTPGSSTVQPSRTNELRSFDTIAVNLLIIVPYILSFLSIAAIFSFGSTLAINSSAENRILVILLAIPALVPWYFAIRKLRNILWGYRVPLLMLVPIYLLFLLPVIDISVSLRGTHVPDGIILLLTAVLSQLYVWFVVYAAKSPRLFSLRVAPPGVLVLVLIFIATIFTI